MPTQSETLELLVLLKDRASRGLGALGTGVNKLRSTIGGLRNALFSIQGLLGGLTIGLLAKSFVNAADTAEQYRTRLTVLLGSQKEGNRLFKEMADYAGKVSFSYEEIMGSATNLAGVMAGGVDEVKQWVPLIGDLAAASGLTIEEATGQVIRMYSAGAASADMFRERGVLAMLGFQAGVSYSAEETRKRLIEAFEDPQSKFAGAANALARTWSGMLSMMGDRWFMFRNMVMEAGVFDYIKAGLDFVLQYFARLQKEGRLDEWARNMANGVMNSFDLIIKGAALVGDAFRGWQMIWYGLKAIGAAVASGWLTIFEGMYTALTTIYEKVYVMAQKAGELWEAITGGTAVTEAANRLGLFIEKQQDITNLLGEQAEKYSEIAVESENELGRIAAQESYYSRVSKALEKVRQTAEDYRKEAEASGGGPRPQLTPQASRLAEQESVVTRGQAATATALKALNEAFKAGNIDLNAYFSERNKLLEDQYKKEVALLNLQKEKAGSDPDKVLAIEDKIFVAKQQHEQALMDLSKEREQAEDAAAVARLEIANKLGELRVRVAEEGIPRLQAAFELELLALQQKQEQELQMLRDQKASEAEIQEAARMQELEKEQLALDQRKRMYDTYKAAVLDGLGVIADGFGSAYEEGGKSVKAFFYIGKAASIARTIMATQEAAMEAYKSLAGIPYVGQALGAAAYAAVIAKGMATVSNIRSQNLAKGGEVEGHSTSDTADDVPAWLTAGEWVHPVKTARYYGRGIMEAIRRRAIPREALMGFSVPAGRPPGGGFGYAAGGEVNAAEVGRAGTELTMYNVVDPALMQHFASNDQGKRAIVNVIRESAFEVRTALGEDQ